MQSILRELYYGNIRPESKFYAKDSPFVQAARVKVDCLEKMAAIGETEKELLDKYAAAQSEIEGIVNYDTFTYALRFGILLMVEIFTNGGGVYAED